MKSFVVKLVATVSLLAPFGAALAVPARAQAPAAEAFWDPADPAPTGVIDGIYNGPTYATNFRMNGSTDGVGNGSGNTLSYLFGYAKPATNKKLSIWLTKGNNTPINIASAVPVDITGKWSLTLNPAQSIVAPGGSVTTVRLLLCEYVAGTPGVDPYDKTTLFCGPFGANSYDTRYDIFDDGLVVQKQNDNQSRMTRGTLYTPNNTLWLCRGWVFDGPSTTQDGYPDVASTGQDWGINPPGHAITKYQVDKNCAGNGGPTWCDPAPAIQVNGALAGQGEEFQWVYGGMMCSGQNRTTITMAAAYRDELTLYPALFEALFDQPIRIEVSAGSGCSSGSVAGIAPVSALVLGVGMRRRGARRRHARSSE
ncbi:MAG: hypothetical protein U0610_12520 [bacterium]